MTESILLAHLALVLLVLHGKHQALRFSLGREQALLLHRFIISLLQTYEHAASRTDATDLQQVMAGGNHRSAR